MALEATSDLVIGQWTLSPRLRALIDVSIQRGNDDVVPALDRLELMRKIDTAEGVWLNYLGERLGIVRPATRDPAMDTRLGFSDDPTSTMASGAGFDRHPLRGDAANDAVYPLGDAAFRRLVKARAILVLGDGTCQTYARAIKMVDPGADVQDRRDMSVRVVTAMRELLILADEYNALPRSAGVEVVYADRGRFGLSANDQSTAAGVGYDQGPLAPDGN